MLARRVLAAPRRSRRYPAFTLIDARAELMKRLGPLGPGAEHQIARAFYLSSALQYLADLRPFADWISRARRYGARAGTPPEPPEPRPEVRLLTTQVAIQFDLCDAVAQAYLVATSHGVTAAEFQTSSDLVERAMHRLMVDFEFVRPRPRNREIDYLRNGLAFALRAWFGDEVGPTIMALLLIVYDEPPPLDAPLNPEAIADEIAERAKSYSTTWQRQARAVRRAKEKYIVVDGTPPRDGLVPGIGTIVVLAAAARWFVGRHISRSTLDRRSVTGAGRPHSS